MTKEEIYSIWNPPESPWSAWTKPVLFSYLTEKDLKDPGPPPRQWEVPRMRGAAIIADLPGSEGLTLGLALSASSGVRPIPVYNACPFANYSVSPNLSILDDSSASQISLPTTVDLLPLLCALPAASEQLAKMALPAAAPPIFLLDANRSVRRQITEERHGSFDNRSFVSASDFPSNEFLQQHGVSRMILIQNGATIQWDLLEILLAWQRGGISIARQKPWAPWNPQFVTLKQRPFLLRILHQFLATGSFHKNPHEVFGKYIPSSAG